MMLDRLKPPKGAVQKKTRRGRGEGSGLGKTSGRGGKGQTARSGGNIKPGFEGGQMPLQRRLPKRGFTNIFKVAPRIVNLVDLARVFKSGETVDSEALISRGVLKKKSGPLKVLGNGNVGFPLTVKAEMFSGPAIEKIKAAGGVAEVI
ncbi:MAG: 50S ribosomal protein L15 [Deltaproteobacteria bacterium]|nr:50S ribosomal protein L15 [Deltaproteobacteria bacterium]